MHHGGDAHGPQGGEGDAAAALHLFPQFPEGGLDAGPHVVQVVGPHAVFQAVLPVVSAGGDGGVVGADKHRLDAGGAQLDAQGGIPLLDSRGDLRSIHSFFTVPLQKFLCFSHHIPLGRGLQEKIDMRKKKVNALLSPGPESAIIDGYGKLKWGYVYGYHRF